MSSITPELYDFIVKVVDDKVKDIRVTREEFDKLIATVDKLAEAQRRTEQRLEQLAEAQRRTEERLERLEAVVKQLAEAQRRTEERLERLEAVVEQLAEAQRRTEETLATLASQVGGLSDTIGFGLEDVARVMIPGWFERHMDIVVEGEFRPTYVSGDGKEFQVNLFGKGRRADGKEVILAGECKSRIQRREVASFAKTLRAVRKAYAEMDVVAFMFGYLVHPSADEEAEKHGILVLAPYRR
jgi:seryl-tRNA synthetase